MINRAEIERDSVVLSRGDLDCTHAEVSSQAAVHGPEGVRFAYYVRDSYDLLGAALMLKMHT